MADYNIPRSDTSLPDVIVTEETLSTIPPLSIPLVGKNKIDYGVPVATIQLHLLENFANFAAPDNVIPGQLWYDKGNQALNVNIGITDGATTDNDWAQVVTTGTYNGNTIGPFTEVNSQFFSGITGSPATFTGAAFIGGIFSGTNFTGTSFSGTNFSGAFTGNLTGNVTGSLFGNATSATSATTATKWASPRTLSLTGGATGSVAMDGSANVSIAVTVPPTGHTHTIAQVTSLQTSLDAKVNKSGDTMTGNLTAPNFIGALTGNATTATSATTATKWSVPRSITLSGDVTGSVAIDGSANVNIVSTIASGVFPPGTRLAFFQAAAPTGWTKLTTINDCMMRVVSTAGGGTGGSDSPISKAFSHTHTTGGYTLTIADIPSHNHGAASSASPFPSPTGSHTAPSYDYGGGPVSKGTSYVGGGGPHNHGATGNAAPTFTPKYADFIICTKN